MIPALALIALIVDIIAWRFALRVIALQRATIAKLTAALEKLNTEHAALLLNAVQLAAGRRQSEEVRA